MIFLSNFIHAWFFCIAPLAIFNQKVTIKQQSIFTLIYGLGVYLSRRIYEFLPVPFGTHTIMLISLGILLFILICKVSVKKSIMMTLLVFIVLIVADGTLSLPVMNFFNIPMSSYENNILHRIILLLLGILPLALMAFVGKVINIRKDEVRAQ